MARIGFIVAEMFEDAELRIPLERIAEAGHEPVIIGVEAGVDVAGKRNEQRVRVDVAAEDVTIEEIDALVIPGGWSPDHLRTNDDVVDLVRDFFDTGKPLAAVCHGPSLLVDADILEGRTLTSWPSIKNDLLNAGAEWVDEPVVVDDNLITSRNPGDLDVFTDAILQTLAEGPEEIEQEEEATSGI